jgi:hypothetical protein
MRIFRANLPVTCRDTSVEPLPGAGGRQGRSFAPENLQVAEYRLYPK